MSTQAKPQSLIMSPSLFKEWGSCGRKGLIGSNRFLGNIHTVYGRAYEYGAKVLIEHLEEYRKGEGDIFQRTLHISDPDLKEDAVKELIVGKAILKSAAYIIEYSLEQHKEKNVFTLSIGLVHTYHYFSAFLLRNNIEQYEERMTFRGPNFTIGGAYDYMAQDITSKVSSLYDFKGITSLWNYSFPSSPQLPIYTVLKQMTIIANGQDKIMSMNGGYVINMTSAKKEEEPLIFVPVNTKLVLATLPNMMQEFIKAAKELEALQTSSPSLLMQYMNSPVGMNTCTAGFNCFHISECETGNFALNTHPDDRVFDKISSFEFSESLLSSAIEKIRKNSSNINLVDGDGLMGGEGFGEGVIDTFFDTDNLALGDL